MKFFSVLTFCAIMMQVTLGLTCVQCFTGQCKADRPAEKETHSCCEKDSSSAESTEAESTPLVLRADSSCACPPVANATVAIAESCDTLSFQSDTTTVAVDMPAVHVPFGMQYRLAAGNQLYRSTYPPPIHQTERYLL